MRIIFLGTPDYAVPSLEAIASSNHEIVAVVTQPDRARGRNANVSMCPVKKCALELGLKVLQYERISREGVEELTALAPDIMITVAFGQILSTKILNIAKYGVINSHASLLPKYRGSAPIQWCVLNGETITGITIMQTALSVDSGDIILQREVNIEPSETSAELFDKLSKLSPAVVLEAIDSIENGSVTYTPQDESKVSHYPMLNKSDGKIDWNMTADKLNNFVRGMNSWPSAYTNLDSKLLKVHNIEILDTLSTSIAGTIVCANNKEGLIVATADKLVSLIIIQPESSKRMIAKDYLLGHKIAVDTVLGE